MKKTITHLLVLGSMLFIGACSTTAKVWKPYDIITIDTINDINPDTNGRPSPIQVKIYELSARSTFDNLDFDRVFYEAKTFLSDELITEATYTIQPSESITHKVNLTSSTRFIAILAGFINIDSSRWKHSYQVKPYGHYKHHISIVNNEIVAGKAEEELDEPVKTKKNQEQKNRDKETENEENEKSTNIDTIKEGIDKGSETLEKANSTKESLNGLFGR